MQPVSDVIYEMDKSPIDKVSSLESLRDKDLEESTMAEEQNVKEKPNT